ncbi:MAG: hypothetical protein AB1Z65_03090 [Candidatus Sulfomarinibacteraceae bacterium]
MNRAAIKQLQKLVLSDRGRQERLRVIADHDAFVSAVLEVAKEHGIDLTPHELEQEMNRAHRAWLLRWL